MIDTIDARAVRAKTASSISEAAVKLGELRARLGAPIGELARLLWLSDKALAVLEATDVHRLSVGALVGYAAAFRARVVVVRDDGSHVEVKP